MTLFERVAGEGTLGAKEKSILDRCVAKVYDLQKSKGVLPCLPLLRNVLQEQPEPEAMELSLMLELFTDGSLNIFSHESNIGVQDKRIVVYNCRDMGEELKSLGQLIVTDQMINRVASNWEQGIRTHIFLDEYHTLLEHEYSAHFFDSAFRRFRKRDAWVTALTQNVEYVLDSLTARTMLSNSEYIIMLNQAASDREKLAELLHISEQQLSYVTNAQAGNGLMRIGSAIVPFINQFPRDSKLYALMTTRPSDRVA